MNAVKVTNKKSFLVGDLVMLGTPTRWKNNTIIMKLNLKSYLELSSGRHTKESSVIPKLIKSGEKLIKYLKT